MSARVIFCPTCRLPFVGDRQEVDCQCVRAFDPVDKSNLLGLLGPGEKIGFSRIGELLALPRA